MEKDDEWSGSGNSYDFGARIYDSRLGRWMSTDNVFKASLSPYQFARNSPLLFIDPDGNDEILIINVKLKSGKIIQLKKVIDPNNFEYKLTEDLEHNIVQPMHIYHEVTIDASSKKIIKEETYFMNSNVGAYTAFMKGSERTGGFHFTDPNGQGGSDLNTGKNVTSIDLNGALEALTAINIAGPVSDLFRKDWAEMSIEIADLITKFNGIKDDYLNEISLQRLDDIKAAAEHIGKLGDHHAGCVTEDQLCEILNNVKDPSEKQELIDYTNNRIDEYSEDRKPELEPELAKLLGREPTVYAEYGKGVNTTESTTKK